MFLKVKCDRIIKGQACVYGRKQRPGLSKENTTLPTVTLEAVLITSVIDAYEEQEIAIFDVPVAFLTAD